MLPKLTPRTYTAEETKKIVVGLLYGRRPRGRGLTDKEYQQRTDPEGYRTDRMIETMDRINTELSWRNDNLEAQQQKQERRKSPSVYTNPPPPPRDEPPATKQGGAINI